MENKNNSLQEKLITLVEKDNGLNVSSKNKVHDGISILKQKIKAFSNIVSLEEINNIIIENFESISDFIKRIDVPLLNKLFGVDLNVVVLPKNTALYLRINWINDSRDEANLFVEIESKTEKEKIDFGIIRFVPKENMIPSQVKVDKAKENTTKIRVEEKEPIQKQAKNLNLKLKIKKLFQILKI